MIHETLVFRCCGDFPFFHYETGAYFAACHGPNSVRMDSSWSDGDGEAEFWEDVSEDHGEKVDSGRRGPFAVILYQCIETGCES